MDLRLNFQGRGTRENKLYEEIKVIDSLEKYSCIFYSLGFVYKYEKFFFTDSFFEKLDKLCLAFKKSAIGYKIEVKT